MNRNTQRLSGPLVAACLALLCSAGAAVASDELDTGNLEVSADVMGACTLTLSNVTFGNYTGEESTATGNVNADCTNGLVYEITLDGGGVTDFSGGRMLTNGGGNTLSYNLYMEDSHATLWGNADHGTALMATSNGSAEDHEVYGRIPAGQTPPVGSYTDTIIVSVFPDT